MVLKPNFIRNDGSRKNDRTQGV